MMSDRKRRELILVDVSVEQMSAVTYKSSEVIANCCDLARNRNSFFDVVVDSKLWVTRPDPTRAACRGSWFGKRTIGARAAVDPHKTVCAQEQLFVLCQIEAAHRLSGCDHRRTLHLWHQHGLLCLWAMASFDNQFRTFVVSDAITSVRGKTGHDEGFRNLERHFSLNVFVATENILASKTNLLWESLAFFPEAEAFTRNPCLRMNSYLVRQVSSFYEKSWWLVISNIPFCNNSHIHELVFVHSEVLVISAVPMY